MCDRLCVFCTCVCVVLTRSGPQRDDDLNELSVTLQLSAQTSVSLMTVCMCMCVCVRGINGIMSQQDRKTFSLFWRHNVKVSMAAVSFCDCVFQCVCVCERAAAQSQISVFFWVHV